MRNFVFAAALALVAAPAFAGDLALGTLLGTTPDAIKTALTELGWDVRKLDTEDGMIEAYAVMGDRMAEIYIDPASGQVVKISDES